MRRPSRELAASSPLCVVGGPNYTQFSDKVHVGRTNVWEEAYHADRADNPFMGGDGLEVRNKPGRVVAAQIRQLDRRPEDVERAQAKLHMTRERNKRRYDRTHRLRPKRIEEGDWVLVFDISPDNQHKAMRKFARRWFGPYAVTSANDNGTYHLAELDGTRLAVPVAGKPSRHSRSGRR